MINFYQKNISPFLHYLLKNITGYNYGCRYTPTCSDYLRLSIKKDGLLKGVIKGSLRVLRCNPLFPGGVDFP